MKGGKKDRMNELAYKVGALLYSPAINLALADKIEQGQLGKLTSMAFCLEDSIQDSALEQAEQTLKQTLKAIKNKNISSLPLLFVRVRTPQHLERVHLLLAEDETVLTGYILPKFDMTNADEYKEIFTQINQKGNSIKYMMPILESEPISNIRTRADQLERIKSLLDSIKDYVLNIRVGGNDFSNLFGVRRNVSQTIYDIGVVRDILVDILNVFSKDYVVSGPVWEYFGNDSNAAWANGLRNELKLDRLNGFIGKTSIHPSQLPIIYDSLMVERSDYDDAVRILNWRPDLYAVEKSADGSRMNEVKCHSNWAKKIIILGNTYGIKEK